MTKKTWFFLATVTQAADVSPIQNLDHCLDCYQSSSGSIEVEGFLQSEVAEETFHTCLDYSTGKSVCCPKGADCQSDTALLCQTRDLSMEQEWADLSLEEKLSCPRSSKCGEGEIVVEESVKDYSIENSEAFCSYRVSNTAGAQLEIQGAGLHIFKNGEDGVEEVSTVEGLAKFYLLATERATLRLLQVMPDKTTARLKEASPMKSSTESTTNEGETAPATSSETGSTETSTSESQTKPTETAQSSETQPATESAENGGGGAAEAPSKQPTAPVDKPESTEETTTEGEVQPPPPPSPPTPSQEVCGQQNLFYNAATVTCDQFQTCEDGSEVLDRATNACLKIEQNCQKQGLYYNSKTVACEEFLVCQDGTEVLIAETNTCITIEQNCQNQNLYFNAATVACEEFKICQPDTEVLVRETNTCITIQQSCQNQGLFYNSATVACEQFLTCQDGSEILIKETNTCITIEQNCKNQDLYFDQDAVACVPFVSCPETTEVLNRATNECVTVEQTCKDQNLYYNTVAIACEAFQNCDADQGLELDRVTNQCVALPPSVSECARQNKYFNADAITCDEWAECEPILQKLDTEENICTTQPPSAAVCLAQDLFYQQSTDGCITFIECPDVLLEVDKATNQCVEKPPSVEVCEVKGKYFFSELGICFDWTTCRQDQDLDRISNTCKNKPPSLEVCTLRQKFFDFAQDACVPWSVCQADEDLQTMSNKCQPKPASESVCEIRDKFFDAKTNNCAKWEECDPITHDLDKSTNTCVQKPPSVTVCAAFDKYFNSESGVCDEWATCDTFFFNLDKNENKCVEKTPTQEICDAKNFYFNAGEEGVAEAKCEAWNVCADDERLERDRNYCAKKPSSEVCNFLDTYFNADFEECQEWRTCSDDLFLNRDANECIGSQTFKQLCQLQNKFFDVDRRGCQQWRICDVNSELELATNLCKRVDRSEQHCSLREYYFRAETLQCEQWKVCEGNDSRLNIQTNMCVLRPEIKCQQLEKRFWDKTAALCVDFVTCSARFARDDETNTCVELFCPNFVPEKADDEQAGDEQEEFAELEVDVAPVNKVAQVTECVPYVICDKYNKVLNKKLNVCEDPITVDNCNAQNKWFNQAKLRCDPFNECLKLKSTPNYKWRLDSATNECRKVKPSFKFKAGLAIVMICTILAGLLYLVLDDRFFCLGNEHVELGTLEAKKGKVYSNGKDKGGKADETNAGNEEDVQRLCSMTQTQYSEKIQSRDLLMKLAELKPSRNKSSKTHFGVSANSMVDQQLMSKTLPPPRRNTVNSLHRRDLSKNAIMNQGSVYAASVASQSEYQPDQYSAAKTATKGASAGKIYGFNRELYKPATALQQQTEQRRILLGSQINIEQIEELRPSTADAPPQANSTLTNWNNPGTTYNITSPVDEVLSEDEEPASPEPFRRPGAAQGARTGLVSDMGQTIAGSPTRTLEQCADIKNQALEDQILRRPSISNVVTPSPRKGLNMTPTKARIV